jgi:predicted Zn finger-like uncharacterized protein
MTIRIVCSGCQAVYQVPDNLLGKKVKCKQCDQVLVVAATPGRTPAAPAAATSVQPRPPAAPPRKPAPRPPAEEPSAEKPAAEPSPAAASRRRKAPPPEEEVPDALPATPDRTDENEPTDDEQPRRARRRADDEEDEEQPRRSRRRAAAGEEEDEAPVRSGRRRDDEDDEDEAPVRPAKKRRRVKGNLTVAMTVAATLAILVLLGSGIVGAVFFVEYYFPNQVVEQPQPSAQPPNFAQMGPNFLFQQQQQESPLIERQANLEAYFRTPEELPLKGMEFTEPLPGGEPAGQDGEAAKATRNTTGQLTPEVLQRIKEATVYLRVKMSQGEGEGSGFFVGEPGTILTNAHVVGMLLPTAPEPTSIRVVRNKGEKNETSFPAQVVAVDHDVDLAVLSVPKEGMPEPLVVKSAQHLQETQPVYVAGFPLGEVPGKSITINKYELSSLKKEKGVLDKLQVHGDMLPGNSGGPVLDADGEVIGVCVSILRNTRINFAIPGDKVCGFLNGRLAELTLETPARVEGRLQVPVTMKLVDPLGHVRQADLDLWTGKPGPARPGSRTSPEPQPGEGPRQTLALQLQQQIGRGELSLPPLPAGQAYWLQPSLVNQAGARVWLSAQVYQPQPPVERKPAKLVLKPAAEWPLLLERWSALQFPDQQGRDHRALLRMETHLTDAAKGSQGNGQALDRHFTSFKEGVSLDGQAYMTRRLQHVGPNMPFLASTRVVDGQGTTNRDYVDSNLIQTAPIQARRDLFAYGEQLEKFLQGLEVALPGKQVQPGETWKARRPLPIDDTWKVLGVLPAPIWVSVETDSLEVTYTYAGLRTVNGTEQAVINFKGQTVQQPGRPPGSGGLLSGTAVVDLATGQIMEEEVAMQTNASLVVLNTVAIKAHGILVARLRRE